MPTIPDDHPVIELDKEHQPHPSQDPLEHGIQFVCGFRLLRRLSELGHIGVSDRSFDRCNNFIEGPRGDHSQPFHFHFSDHLDSFPFIGE